MPIYMKYGDIKGDVTAAGHVDWIELTSAQFGVMRPGGGGTDRPGIQTVEEIVATKATDKASPLLVQEALSGKATTATLDFAERDGHVYLTVTLTGTLISSYHVSHGGDRPTESLGLHFTKIEFVKS